MKKCVRTGVQSVSLVLILLAPPHAAAPGGSPFPEPSPLYAREPDVGAATILFVSGDDLWMVPRAGGVARRVAAGAGPKRRPKLSPDGATIAFTGRHDALYTVPAAGGESRRVTHHPGATDLCDWTADGRLLFMTDGFLHLFNGDGQARIRQLFTVAAGGGLPERIPLPYGANATIDDAGEWLAYTYYAEGRSEARGHHLGGNAPDVWLFNLSTRASRKITQWEGIRSEEHTSELQSLRHLVCRLLLEKKNTLGDGEELAVGDVALAGTGEDVHHFDGTLKLRAGTGDTHIVCSPNAGNHGGQIEAHLGV